MVVRAMWGHKLSLFVREHVEEIVVLHGDDFSDEFTLVGRKGFGMQHSRWCGIITDGSKRGPRRFSGGGFEMEREYFLSLFYECLACRCVDQAYQGWCASSEGKSIESLREREGVIRVVQGS